jgi:hypothetical protein
VVPDVQISVTNSATAVTRKTTTDRDGYFQVLELPIGDYTVTAQHDGFQTVVSDAQKLLIGQALRIDLKMPVGTTSQTLNVEATGVTVETVNSTLGQSVTSRALVNPPLNGRDVMDLALLQPGITESNDDNAGAGNFSIAGGRTDSVTYLLDGGLNNDLLDISQLLNPNPDSVAEFRLLSSNYSAEYGRNGGGIISVVRKSGTNFTVVLSNSSGTPASMRTIISMSLKAFRGTTSNEISSAQPSVGQFLKIGFSSLPRTRDNGKCRM